MDRPRLRERVAARHERRLVTVVAGAGFGKTALLVSALRDAPSASTDVWLTCEPADADGVHLEGGLVTAMGLGEDAGVGTLCEAVWAKAPSPVCFVFDDVHEIPKESSGAALLQRLVDDLPANGHLLLASREPVPVPIARLVAAGQADRVKETDLLLAEDELAAFARSRGLDPALLTDTGGWPALAELSASAGGGLVLDYLWEEVLARLPSDRVALLARLAVVGGGGDEIASALAGRRITAADAVAGLPLVQRADHAADDDRVALHPLWEPPLRRVLDPDDADEARVRAAAVHRRLGRASEAVELLAEADAVDDVLDVVRDVLCGPPPPVRPPFGRWVELLPAARREEPAARLAAGLALRPSDPVGALAQFHDAAAGFRAVGDGDGEVAALAHLGSLLWLRGDLAALFDVKIRVDELAAAGVARAAALRLVGDAAVAHLSDDPAGVLEAVRTGDERISLLERTHWPTVLIWFRSVAHRRLGDVARAVAVLGPAPVDDPRRTDAWMASLRARWLAGEVDEVVAELPRLLATLQASEDDFNAAGAWIELVAHRAWLGHGEEEGTLARVAPAGLEGAGGTMAEVMTCIARAASALALGDERRAAHLVEPLAEATIGTSDGWYWWDRGAVALVHILAPAVRDRWASVRLAPTHRTALRLAEALAAARDGDLGVVAALDWPAIGICRTALPAPWLVELACAGEAADNPAPDGLLDAVGPAVAAALRRTLEDPDRLPSVGDAARAYLAVTPAMPDAALRLVLLGPLVVERDGAPVEHRDLRRARVRELLTFLVVRGRVRREEVSGELWPDLDDRGRNLRVTLSYLQKVLQPERGGDTPPYFLRTDGGWLTLQRRDHLTVDLWSLDAILDDAERADRLSDPAGALAHYERALPLWIGEPLADVPYADWAAAERTRIRLRYVAAAVRAGELLLATRRTEEAAAAALRALVADHLDDSAHQLLIRARQSVGDVDGERRAVEQRRRALTDVGLEP